MIIKEKINDILEQLIQFMKVLISFIYNWTMIKKGDVKHAIQ